jgi:cytochrome c biogenesis protein
MLNKLGKIFYSMKTGLFLLLLLAVFASVGGIIPQEQATAYYMQQYGRRLGSVIILLSFDSVYSSWWFLWLTAILSINILFCSGKRIRHIKNRQQLGSIILHLSILLIVIGALISATTSHEEYIELGVGDSVQLAEEQFAKLKLTAKDFKVEYYDNHQPKQYISKLLLTTKTGDGVQKELSVNHPLKIDGVKIYQQNYGYLVNGQIIIDGKPATFKLRNGKEVALDEEENLRLRLLFIPDFDEETQSLLTKSPMLHNPRLVGAVMRGDEVIAAQALAVGETREIKGYPVTFSGHSYFTGLQVKRDNGTVVVFSGFAIMLLGFAIRYLPNKNLVRGKNING